MGPNLLGRASDQIEAQAKTSPGRDGLQRVLAICEERGVEESRGALLGVVERHGARPMLHHERASFETSFSGQLHNQSGKQPNLLRVKVRLEMAARLVQQELVEAGLNFRVVK